MSLPASTWVWEHSRSKGLDRLVLLAIADHADSAGGRAWPSLARLAARCGMSRRSVMRSIDRLVAEGDLERIQGGGVKGRGGTTNGYQLSMKRGQTGTTLPPGPDPKGGQSVTTPAPLDDEKGCQAVPSDPVSLGTACPEVVTESPSSGDPVAPEPSRTTQNHSLIDSENHSDREPDQPPSSDDDDQQEAPVSYSSDPEQVFIRTAVLVGRAVAARRSTDDERGYAHGVTKAILKGPDPEDRDRIRAMLAEGLSPEAVVERWAETPDSGLDPFGVGPKPVPVDPAAVQAAADRAKRREAETAEMLAQGRTVPRDDEAGLAAVRQIRSARSAVG